MITVGVKCVIVFLAKQTSSKILIIHNKKDVLVKCVELMKWLELNQCYCISFLHCCHFLSDCPEKILLFTGEELVRNVPSNAESLHVTYSQSPDHSQLLWERRNSIIGRRGRVSGNVFTISEVTHKDNGEYNFRDEKTSMVLQIQLDVRGNDGRIMTALFGAVHCTSYEIKMFSFIVENKLFGLKNKTYK